LSHVTSFPDASDSSIYGKLIGNKCLPSLISLIAGETRVLDFITTVARFAAEPTKCRVREIESSLLKGNIPYTSAEFGREKEIFRTERFPIPPPPM
jgi:hypothetical protein